MGRLRLRRSLRAGNLVRVGYDTYLEPHDARVPVWERRRDEVLARCVRMQARAGETFAVSHTTAALVHGLWVPSSTRIHVTQPHARMSTPERFDPVLRHRRRLTEGEVVVVDGLRATSLERTVVDCACLLPADWALAVADCALRTATGADRRQPEKAHEQAARLLVDWRALLEWGPRRGRRQARAVLDLADPLAESPGESRSRAAMLAAGLPVPTLQVRIQVDGRDYWADGGWPIAPGHYLLWEFDGTTKYGLDGVTGPALARALSQEKQREDGIRRLGQSGGRVVDADLSNTRARAAMVRRMWDKLPPRLLEDSRSRPGLFVDPGS